jgi:putative transcriptional regulator
LTLKIRNLFDEIAEGFEALAGKRTLRTHDVEVKPAPEVTAPARMPKPPC